MTKNTKEHDDDKEHDKLIKLFNIIGICYNEEMVFSSKRLKNIFLLYFIIKHLFE